MILFYDCNVIFDLPNFNWEWETQLFLWKCKVNTARLSKKNNNRVFFHSYAYLLWKKEKLILVSSNLILVSFIYLWKSNGYPKIYFIQKKAKLFVNLNKLSKDLHQLGLKGNLNALIHRKKKAQKKNMYSQPNNLNRKWLIYIVGSEKPIYVVFCSC